MRKSLKLAAAIAAASTSTAYAACPAGTTDVSATYTGIAGFPAFTDYCELEGVYNSNMTLTADTLWVLDGKVEIGTSVTSAETSVGSKRFIINEITGPSLTVDAGTTIIGDSLRGSSFDPTDYLVINRGSDVFMNGTDVAPIRMTGVQELDPALTPASGNWGGLYINGYGVTNECDEDLLVGGVGGTGAGAGDCERAGEADTGRYGGASNSDDSGSITYVTAAYAGAVFNPTTDLNGIAFQAVGSGTTVENIQVHANVDDGVEFYGGAVNVKNVVLTDNGDDSFDSTGGWQGNAQYVLIAQQASGLDRAFESDNNKSPNDAAPLTNGKVANVTVIRTNSDTSDVLKVRRGSALGLHNMILAANTGTCFDIDDGDGDGFLEAPLVSVLADCGTMTDKPESDTWIANGDVTQGITFFNGYINMGTTSAQATDMNAVDSFFETTSFIGAVENCDSDWTTGWTVAGTLPAVDPGLCDSGLVDTFNVPVMGWAGLVALFGGLAGVARMTRRVK